jgi:hypothetical protein
MGTTTVSEVLYVPPNDAYGNAYDYGSGPISMFYNGAITLSQQYFGYPALNASTIVEYAAFEYTPYGEELWECNGPVTSASTTSGTAYAITLGGVETAYGLGPAQLSTTLTSLSLGSGGLGMPPPQASVSLTSVSLELFNITTGMNLFISVVNASAVYGLPTFGFILNATNFYGIPSSFTCKYNQWVQIG